MTDHQFPVSENVDAMLDLVRRNCEDQCRAIDAEAKQNARDIIASAHKEARAKVHDVIVEERRNGQRAIDKQRAKIETAKRQNFQDQENAFLHVIWQQLKHELVNRWQDDAARQDWLRSAVDQALGHLHPGGWRIEHPQNWLPVELGPYLDRIKSFSGDEVAFVAVKDFDVGVRIQANGVVVDATLSGVLADQKEIAALLLAELFVDAEVSS